MTCECDSPIPDYDVHTDETVTIAEDVGKYYFCKYCGKRIYFISFGKQNEI